MGRKSAVGVMNGNWRDGDYYQYEQAKKSPFGAMQVERVMTKKKMRAQYWNQRLANAIGALRSVDSSFDWKRWFDDDENVPADANAKEMTLLVETKVKELSGERPAFRTFTRRGIFIWWDEAGYFLYSKEVGKETLYVLTDFDNLESAEAFVNGLPFTNLGYGVVLDLLPASILAAVEG